MGQRKHAGPCQWLAGETMTSAKDRLNQTLPELRPLPIVLEVALLDAAAHLPADVAAAVLLDAATRLSDLAAVLGQTYLPWRETTVLLHQLRCSATNVDLLLKTA